MHYLVTGHTGFKGSWLTLLLRSRGHQVSGISLSPVSGGLFDSAGLENLMEHHKILDIRNRVEVAEAVSQIAPDVVIHMAAQPLVIESYIRPVETIDINVGGTLNVLSACDNVDSVKVVLVITTDKVYLDAGLWPYSEDSPLGGRDPYSASKAMADLLAQSWLNLNPGFRLGIARAGNVIGFGDVSENRLVPDLVRGLKSGCPVQVRNPNSVRPWQHVLDCVNGYTSYVDALLSEPKEGIPRVLNFGPSPDSYRTVRELVDRALIASPGLRIEYDAIGKAILGKETDYLTLDSSRARFHLGWEDRVNLELAVTWSLVAEQSDALETASTQIEAFEAMKRD